MDYGPFLTASIEAPGPGTNIAFKGIAIRLRDQAGAATDEAVVFDTDLLRYSAGWTGGFVALKGVVFDGEHWAYPRIGGQQIFGNPVSPGWAKDGRFSDPRAFNYGPLPRDWAHWKGLYLHDQQVVLNYTVSETEVLEIPSVETHESLVAFVRAFEIAPHTNALTLQLADEEGAALQMLDRASLRPVTATDAETTVASLQPPVETAAPADLSRDLAAHWDFDVPGDGRLVSIAADRRALRMPTPGIVEGRSGHALAFEADTAAIVEPAADLDLHTRDASVAVWVRANRDGTILAQTASEGSWAPNDKALFVRGGRLVFDVGWVGAVESVSPVSFGRWTHVAVTWSRADGGVALFVDGQPAGAGTLKPAAPLTNFVTRVGFGARDFPATSHFRGALDDLRWYRRQLSAAEIRQLAGARQTVEPLLAAVVGGASGARWDSPAGGHLRLTLAPSTGPRRFKVLLSRADANARPVFSALLRQSAAPDTLEPLIRGGPPRWDRTLTTRGKLGAESGPFAGDTITAPDDNPWNSWMRFGGFDFFRDATRAAICTWNGDVWLVSGIHDDLTELKWRRFATGLFQPLGLKIVDEQIYVLGRDQITRLHDLNGDGEADFYENFNNDTMTSEHFHEFAVDLQTDAAGDFYYVKCARHARDALHPHHGTLVKVSKDGSRTELLANGFRAPNGLEVTANGEFYSTDQEGYWMPANRLNRIERGKFYGNVWSWCPDGKPTRFDEPICWIHPRVDRSPSTMAVVTSDRWGLPKDTLLSVSYGVGRIFVVPTQTIDGLMQGGVTPLPIEFDTGIMRTRFNPRDGQLYTCGLYGWAGNKTQAGGFYRVRHTGQPLRLPVGLNVLTNGVVLTFTTELDPVSASEPGNYSVERWNYRWTANYGSPDYRLNGEPGRDRVEVKSARVAADRRRVFLELSDVQPVMQMNIQMNLRAADGAPVQTFVHHTIHRVAAERGEQRLGEVLPGAAVVEQPRLAHEAPGLINRVYSAQVTSWGTNDARRARLVALNVPAGTSPTPYLPPGKFTATWDGFLKLELSEDYHFFAWGRGRVWLKINDADAIPPSDATPAQINYPTVRLRAGLNRLQFIYESAADGLGLVRLFWKSGDDSWEPVPPTAFVFDAAEGALKESDTRRLGRELFASRLCVKCHDSGTLISGEPMPELSSDAPALDDVLPDFRTDWLVRYLQNPQLHPDGWMPSVLHGSPEQVRQDATDITAFLDSLITPFYRSASAVPLPAASAAVGGDLYAKFGCVACHVLPGERALPNDTRLSLSHTAAKWQPSRLAEFLQDPSANYRWIRMPNFQLTATEAQALAAYLLEKSDRPPATVAAVAGDVERGRRLAAEAGCANCHEVSLSRMPNPPRPLADLRGVAGTSGCLAGDSAKRGRAPDFRFRPDELAALRGFLRDDVASLSADVPSEYAERQFRNLRCASCHEREDAKDGWAAIEALAATAAPKVVNPYDDSETADTQTVHRRRPPLTLAGEKLRAEWMTQLFAGQLGYKARPKLEARMPDFVTQAAGLAMGLAMQHGCEAASPAPPAIRAELVPTGQALAQKGALGCVDCHAVGDQAALAGTDMVTINFAYIPERLRREYFDRYARNPARLLPGTMMPSFMDDKGRTGVTAHFDGDGAKQFEALWNFMRTVKRPLKDP